jgi:hypothetical protein
MPGGRGGDFERAAILAASAPVRSVEALAVGLCPIVTLQYRSTTLYQVSYQIQ